MTEEGGRQPRVPDAQCLRGCPAPWIEMGHQGVGDQRVSHSWESAVLLPRTQGTAPFLHMGALAAVTALSWIVAGQFARAERSCKCDWAGPAPSPPFPRCALLSAGPWGPWGLQLQSAVPASSSESASVSVSVWRVGQSQGHLSLVTMGLPLVQGLFRARVS